MSKARDIADLLDSAGKVTADDLDVGAIGGRRNLIINGGFQVSQRGTSVSFGDAYTLDRWRIVGGSSPERVATQESNTSYSSVPHEKFLKCTNPQGQEMWTTQRIENARQFSGKAITISYWVWSTTGNYTAASGSWGALQDFSGAQYNVSGWGGASVNVTTTPQYVTHTFTFADVSSYVHTEGDFFEWNIYHNTSNDLCITGVQLELGSVATPFEHRSYGEELALCQRYYEVMGDGTTDVAGGTDDAVASFGYSFPCKNYVMYFKTTKRASPSVQVIASGGGGNTTYYPDKDVCRMSVTSAYRYIQQIAFDAEL